MVPKRGTESRIGSVSREPSKKICPHKCPQLAAVYAPSQPTQQKASHRPIFATVTDRRRRNWLRPATALPIMASSLAPSQHQRPAVLRSTMV